MRRPVLTRAALAAVFTTCAAGFAWLPGAAAPQNPPPQPPPTAQPPVGGSAAAPGQGRGGRGGSPGAAVYAQFCAACHGPTLQGGSAGSLVDERVEVRQRRRQHHRRAFATAGRARRWCRSRTCSTTTRSVSSSSISGTQADTAQGQARSQGRSRRARRQVREADGEAGGRRPRSRDAVGHRLPAGQAHARQRTSGQPAHRREGQAAAGRHRNAGAVGAAGRRLLRRRSPSAVREERLDLSRRTPNRSKATRRRPSISMRRTHPRRRPAADAAISRRASRR